jgi:hypothetical protein
VTGNMSASLIQKKSLIENLCVAILLLLAIVTSNVLAQELPITKYQLSPEKLKQAEALYYTHIITYVVGTLYSILLLVLIRREQARGAVGQPH